MLIQLLFRRNSINEIGVALILKTDFKKNI